MKGSFEKIVNLEYMNKRVYDDSFKQMAVELSYARGSVKEVADELGEGLTDDQKEIKRLQKELREAQLERDILKKAISIFSRGDGRYTDS